MGKESIHNLRCWLLESEVDGLKKKVSGYHIDEIEKHLEQRQYKRYWLSKALTFLPQAYIMREQLCIPWNLFLVLYLKDRRKHRAINLCSQNALEQELHRYTPPELILFAQDYDHTHNLALDASTSPHLTPYTEVYYAERFDTQTRSYARTIYIEQPSRQIFRLMAGNLYFGYKQTLCTNASDAYIAAKNKRRLTALLASLQKDMHDSALLTELGALLLVAFDQPEQALAYLYKALDRDHTNSDTYFWLALYFYYYKSDTCEAEKILQQAYTLHPYRADYSLMLFRLQWQRTKSQEKALNYLQAACKQEPSWILPRLCWIRFLVYLGEYPMAKSELEQLKKSLTPYKKTTDILKLYYDNYITGNNTSSKRIINQYSAILHHKINLY